MTLSLSRLRRRWACHRSLICCHYVDQPTCNSFRDPHLSGRLYMRYVDWRYLKPWERAVSDSVNAGP